ncbi:hypothetical protein [Demequina maris]|uniref:hypothetical protein n=1 Tax=Demequina maris TaxID=1638982 RepID=UPI0007855678|nr:hypothetical protein [Demequina maris]
MTGDLLTELESHGAAMAGRLGPEGAAAARGRIAKVRRRRAAGVVAVLVPVLGLGGWFLGTSSRASNIQPAHTDPTAVQISYDEPLEPQVQQAIVAGDHDAMRKLFELGAYPLHIPVEGQYYVESAVARCDLEALTILDDVGARRAPVSDISFDVAIEPAVTTCGADVVEHVLETSPVEIDQVEVMSMAASRGEPDVVTLLARRGYPLEVPGEWSALDDAARAGEHRAVAVLLEEGADPTVVIDGVPLAELVDREGTPVEIVDAIRAAAGVEG